MRGIEPSYSGETDANVIQAAAQRDIDEARVFKDSDFWQRISACIQSEIEGRLERLAKSEEDGEKNRGAIRSLRDTAELPDRLIREAGNEISKHRGI